MNELYKNLTLQSCHKLKKPKPFEQTPSGDFLKWQCQELQIQALSSCLYFSALRLPLFTGTRRVFPFQDFVFHIIIIIIVAVVVFFQANEAKSCPSVIECWQKSQLWPLNTSKKLGNETMKRIKSVVNLPSFLYIDASDEKC